MPFRKGEPRPPNAGRKPGSKNKLNSSARARLEELGCDPIEGMARIAMDSDNSPELRHKAYADIAQYAYPKLKAVDHTFGGSGTLNTHASGTEQLASGIASLAAKLGAGKPDPQPE